jgi:hypothetical protein
MARSLGLIFLVLVLTACRASHVAASGPYTVEHVRQVFFTRDLSFTVPRSFAVGYACTRLTGLRAFLDGGSRWHGELYKDEQSAIHQTRCMNRVGLGGAYLHLRRRNLVVVAKTTLRGRLRAALAAL